MLPFGEKLPWYFPRFYFLRKLDKKGDFAKNSIRFITFYPNMVRFRSNSLSKVLGKVDTFGMYHLYIHIQNQNEARSLPLSRSHAAELLAIVSNKFFASC
jgi:hypothetical protein